ncbi:hypothetical protein [Leptospira noguchii]|nr:hypothetical protein [Leptospira noguchii]UOG31470.1 hypothetical protein MAL06_05480 [Leptospira noguchii]UOG51737.1 hypothetical protein MAL09_13775 [Leptospira noguchii]
MRGKLKQNGSFKLKRLASRVARQVAFYIKIYGDKSYNAKGIDAGSIN